MAREHRREKKETKPSGGRCRNKLLLCDQHSRRKLFEWLYPLNTAQYCTTEVNARRQFASCSIKIEGRELVWICLKQKKTTYLYIWTRPAVLM